MIRHFECSKSQVKDYLDLIAKNEFNWDLEKIKKSNLEAIKHSFASEKIKNKLRNIIESSY